MNDTIYETDEVIITLNYKKLMLITIAMILSIIVLLAILFKNNIIT